MLHQPVDETPRVRGQEPSEVPDDPAPHTEGCTGVQKECRVDPSTVGQSRRPSARSHALPVDENRLEMSSEPAKNRFSRRTSRCRIVTGCRPRRSYISLRRLAIRSPIPGGSAAPNRPVTIGQASGNWARTHAASAPMGRQPVERREPLAAPPLGMGGGQARDDRGRLSETEIAGAVGARVLRQILEQQEGRARRSLSPPADRSAPRSCTRRWRA
jgi:hypothetical protein